MRSAARRYRASLVGLGVMGSRHARAFASLGDRFEIVGAYDVRAESPSCAPWPWLSSEAEAIERADVVIVATPTDSHAGTVSRALAAGRHVLVEKPLCRSAKEASALAAMGSRGPGRLFVGHSERFNPVIRALARLLRGERVLAIDISRVGPSRPPSDCGVLLNLGVHDFDLATYLAGAPISLRSAVGTGSPGEAGEDLAHVLFTSGGGAAGHLLVDRTAPAKRRRIAIATARFSYEGDLLHPRLERASRGAAAGVAARTEVPLPLGEPLVAQAEALADALDGRHGPTREIASGRDGAYAVALAERARLVCAILGEGGPREKLVASSDPLLPRE